MPGGTDRLLVRTLLFGAGPGTLVVCGCRVVFGTLLGPEATGPGRVCFSRVVCFWFPGCTVSHGFLRLRGVCGVCGTGLLFENYIVDASIFYKKQFPRYLNLDLAVLWHLSGCCGVVGFCGSLEKMFLIFVVKFLRAHGGCLGIRSRRRT